MARSTLWKHRKFRRLVMQLKGNKALAVGLLECLWSCGYDSGDDLIGSASEVEVAAGWCGRKGQLVPILERTGWIDLSPEGYRIHDLYDHAPEYVQRRRRRELQRGQRSDTDGSLTGHRRVIDPNPPTRTRTPQPLPPPYPPGESGTADGFKEFWEAYPQGRRIKRDAALRAWISQVRNGDANRIMAALAWQVTSADWKRDGGRFVPTPENYLWESRWLDERPKNPFLDEEGSEL